MIRDRIIYPELRHAKAKIVKDFYAAYDPSLVWREWESSAGLNNRVLSGEGRHFKSYRIKGAGGMDLALNIAKPGFLMEIHEREAWVDRVKQIRDINHPILPPTEVLKGSEDQLICIQPYCETPLTAIELARPQMRALIEDLTSVLRNKGLQFDDYWQLRSCRGHPFVIDMSELKSVENRGFSLR